MTKGALSLNRPKTSLEQAELFCAVLGVLFSTFISFRAPFILFTASDFFLTVSLMLRCTRSIPKFPIHSATSMWMLGVGMVVAGLLIGGIAHGNPENAFVVIVQYFFSLVLLPLAILGRPYKEAVLLAKVGVVSIGLNCLIGMIAYAVGYSTKEGRQFILVSGNRRVTGLVDNPNGLAGLIVLWFPILWYLGLARAFRPAVFLGFFALTFITLIFTSSNSSLAGAFICALIYLLLLGKFKVFLIWTTAITCIVAIGLRWAELILPPTFRRRVLTPILEGDLQEAGTFDDRADLMVEAWRLLPDYMLIGMGGGRYREVSADNISVHNLYLLLANEGSLMALFGLALIFLAAIVSALLVKSDTPHKALGRATVITITLTFAALAMNFTHVYQRGILVPWIVSIGLLSVHRMAHSRQ
ncbi:O-antigen ligase family protein [Ruegeria arenilitoris]|uniref:O-antigen ligase family protein n=1 Tax=Ruegeria arenilitoris TaxID=1173585 RepID=UPI00147EB929|nr:O-antigen ligase family protein [Ruegeria arenilitoris]